MITAPTVVGIDVSRDRLDGLCLPGEKRFRLANSAEAHELLVAAIREMPGPVKIGFDATGGQEWVLWATLVAAGIVASQLPPAQIKAFALSRGTRAKTDRIDAEMIARFMQFRPAPQCVLSARKSALAGGLHLGINARRGIAWRKERECF